MRWVLLFALAGVAGCNTEYVKVPVEVRVPIPVPCVVEVEPPRAYATESLEPGASDGDILRALLVEREERGAVESMLRAALVVCGG